MNSLAFKISERHERGDHSWSWRLKDGQIRFRGTGQYARLVTQRIPASKAQIESIYDAFELLAVWQWRNDYHPNDADREVLDGSWWLVDVASETQVVRASGENAYPSYGDATITSLSRDRFELVLAAFWSTFAIDHYVDQARQK